MRLRGITEHVKAQNWFAVWLDFVIVVVGVFIGIQVANLNEARNERQRETQILREIATDLKADTDQYEENLDASLDKISALNHIFDAAFGAPPLSTVDSYTVSGKNFEDYLKQNKQLLTRGTGERVARMKGQLWSHGVTVSNVQPNETSFLSLENTGKLGIVRNQLLLKQLQQYRNTTAGIQKAQDVTFRPARGQAIELGHSYGLSIFGEMEDEALIKLVAANPPLAAVLKTQLGFAKGHFALLAAANEKAALLLQAVEREIAGHTGKSSTP